MLMCGLAQQLIVTARYTRYMLMCGLAHTINSNSKVHKVHANVWFSTHN